MLNLDFKEIQSFFEKLEIEAGDSVMIHSAIYTLGRIDGGVNTLLEVILDILGGSGNLIVPTFTYSFRRNEIFDYWNTPSAKEIGILSELVRSRETSVRSLDPLFSVAAIGPDASDLMQRENKNSFGEGSIYEKIFERNTKIVSIGVPYSSGITAFMHIERLANVPYRQEELFSGYSIDNTGNKYADECLHFSRNESDYPELLMNREGIGKKLEEEGASLSTKLGYGKHFSITSSLFKDIVLRELSLNSHVMVEKC